MCRQAIWNLSVSGIEPFEGIDFRCFRVYRQAVLKPQERIYAFDRQSLEPLPEPIKVDVDLLLRHHRCLLILGGSKWGGQRVQQNCREQSDLRVPAHR